MKRKFLFMLTALLCISGAVRGDIETRQRSIAESFFKEGVYYFNQQEYTAASNALIRALSSDPTYYKARYWLGRAYYQSGYTKNALVEWERVLNLVGEDHLLKNKVTRLLYQTVGGQPKLPLEERYLPTKGLYHPVRREISNPTSIFIDR
ncbi:MAG: tetratricopeptide repeat protein, partial [Spirochaetota bacterium]|nr:tetratricopeptide repeat protein [Spirochaetota bacterium]